MIQVLKTVLPIQETVRAKEKKRICLNTEKKKAAGNFRGARPYKDIRHEQDCSRSVLENPDKSVDYTEAVKNMGASPFCFKIFYRTWNHTFHKKQ